MLDKVISSAKKKILYLPHAVQQMSRPERMITPLDVEKSYLVGKLLNPTKMIPGRELLDAKFSWWSQHPCSLCAQG